MSHADRVRAHWAARAGTYDAVEPTEGSGAYWRHVATNVLCQRTEVREDDTIVDLGCGTGNVARTLAPHAGRVIGVDFCPEMLDRARDELGVTWVEADAREVAVPLGTHVVTACFSLSQLLAEDRRALFERLHAKLTEGGLLVLADWYANLPFEDIEGIEGWFPHDLVDGVPAMTVLRELEERGYRVVHEPLHPAVSVLTAMRM